MNAPTEIATPNCVIRGLVKVEWVDLGEGNCGDYDPDDPTDVSLLRFDVYFWDKQIKDWVAVDDSSYCTQVPVETPDDEKLRLLLGIMGEVKDEVESGHSIKKLCERLSWIDPTWYKKETHE